MVSPSSSIHRDINIFLSRLNYHKGKAKAAGRGEGKSKGKGSKGSEEPEVVIVEEGDEEGTSFQ